MTKRTQDAIDPGTFVDQLYDIAIDPQALDVFIDAWNDAGLDARDARQTVKSFDQFDLSYQAHLERAETFLSRGQDVEERLSLAATLQPFENLTAFIVDEAQCLIACNPGAQQAFGCRDGDTLSKIPLPAETIQILRDSITRMFERLDRSDYLLKLEASDHRAPTLFQMRLLNKTEAYPHNHILVVTTQYHWQPVLNETLEDVFGLTSAEQGIVRALVEGLDAKTIASGRGTTEGTVRGQIKSVLSKMNARTQSEVIRLVLSLREMSQIPAHTSDHSKSMPVLTAEDWWQAEVWKPFKSLTLPDGRRLDYHDMGPINGAPVLYSHMGYCAARWHKPMLKLAFHHSLRIICPIRAGYGHSENINPRADVLETTRADTTYLLDHLQIAKLPYLTQGNDMIFAVDYAACFPERITEIIGICARPCLSGDRHYSGMGKWHRFFLSTAKHAPHLLKFTAKAAVSMAKRIGVIEMFRQMNQRSPADMALLDDEELLPVLVANGELIAGRTTDISQAYTMELLVTESNWAHLVLECQTIKTWFVNGAEDPATDVATIAEYREAYPWIDIEIIPNAGQLLIFQQYENLIPRIAAAANAAVISGSTELRS